MSKVTKLTPKAKAPLKTQSEAMAVPAPWACRHEATKSYIDAYVDASGEWETVAEVLAQKGVDAKATAEYITRLANDGDQIRQAMRAALSAIDELRTCAGKNVTFDAEQEADVAESKIKALLAK